MVKWVSGNGRSGRTEGWNVKGLRVLGKRKTPGVSARGLRKIGGVWCVARYAKIPGPGGRVIIMAAIRMARFTAETASEAGRRLSRVYPNVARNDRVIDGTMKGARLAS
jgi:hypothetical protein